MEKYVTPGARIARPSVAPTVIKQVTDDPFAPHPSRDTIYNGPNTTAYQPNNQFEMTTDTPSLPPLHQTYNEALVLYGAFFVSTLASLVTRNMYVKIASHMCTLTNSKLDTRNWFRTLKSCYKHIFDNNQAADEVLHEVLPQDRYIMQGVWTDGGVDGDITTASVSTKLKWLRFFLDGTHTLRARMLIVPFHDGLEEFVAMCLVNNVMVVHESIVQVHTLRADEEVLIVAPSPAPLDTHEADIIELDDVEPTPEKLGNEADTHSSCQAADTRDASSSGDTRADYSSDDDSEFAEVPETADTDDTITELPCSQLVLVSRRPAEEEDVLNICKSFSEKALAYPSGDVLKLLEHTLEERNKLILKVISMEMELKAVRGG